MPPIKPSFIPPNYDSQDLSVKPLLQPLGPSSYMEQKSETTETVTMLDAEHPLSTPETGSSHSISESIRRFPKENGRTYHAYHPGSYFFPNDPAEADRLEFQYILLKNLFSARNYFAPLKDLKPKEILDIGTGPGMWAIEMGDAFPDATISATDLSPIQPSYVPKNVFFFIEDAADEWSFPANHFDYIHTRVLLGSMYDFKEQIVVRAFEHLRPGGWFESQEVYPVPYCDDGTMDPKTNPLCEWARDIDDAAMEADRPLRIANKLKRWYTEAGFVDVHEKVFKLPVNGWPQDFRMKELGKMWEQNLLTGISGLSLGFFSRVNSWSLEEIEGYLINVRKAISDKRVHVYHKVYVVWGRKPDGSPTPTPDNRASSS